MGSNTTSTLARAACFVSIPALLPFWTGWAEAGFEAAFTIGQRVEVVDEENASVNDDEGTRSVTNLNFGLSSETRNQSFGLELGTRLSYNFSDSEDLDRELTTARLSYGLTGATSSLDFAATFRQTDVDESTFLDEDIDDDLVIDSGTRDVFSLRTRVETGRDGPANLTLAHTYTTTEFSGTTDPDLRDSTRNRLNGNLALRLSPVATANIFTSFEDFEQDGTGGTDRQTLRFGLGGTFQATKATSLSAELSYSDIDTNTGSDSEGLGFALGASHVRPNGTISGDISSTETVNGTRTIVSIGRSFVYKWGEAALSLGASQTGDLDTQPQVNARLNYAIDPLSTLQLSLNQTATANNDDEETVRTALRVGYNRTLTTRSSLTGSLQLSDQNVVTGGGEDRSVLRVSLAYRYTLANDWDLVSGVEYSRIDRETSNDETSNTLFVGIERTFNWRP